MGGIRELLNIDSTFIRWTRGLYEIQEGDSKRTTDISPVFGQMA
jgi:hypothetical protein